MSGADDPRRTELWPEAVVAARTVLEAFLALTPRQADEVAEAVTQRLLGDFLAHAEAESEPVFTLDGTGPWCSWCGRLPGPRVPKGHPQHGVFCDCKRAEKPQEGEPAEAVSVNA